MLVVAVAGCGGGAVEEEAPSGARPYDLLVGPALPLRQGVATARAGFHAIPQGLAATGRAHQLQLRGTITEVRTLPAASLRRQQIEAAVRGPARTLTGAATPSGQRSPASQLLAARGADAPALQLETVSIARAGFECVRGTAPAALAGDGAGGAVRGFDGCSERWTNDQQGAEVAFAFPARPAGSGDLVVAVRARLTGGAAGGPLAVTSDARGLHFQATGATPFLYGHATWVDAAGARTPVAARWTGAAIELDVPAAVVDASRYPAVLDPVVGPDLGTDRPVLAPASAGMDPDVAFDGTNHLVVFEDFTRIRAVRADAAGTVLDAPWIDLGEDGMQQFEPAVACGGGHCLVTWWQDDGVALAVKGRLVNPDGTLVGAGSIAISAEDAIDDAVAWNGDSFLVSWTGFGDPSAIRVALVDAAGALVPGSQRSVSSTGNAGHPRIAAGATTAVVAWADFGTTTDFSNRIFAARVARDGTVLDPGGVRLSANESNEDQVKLASAGASFLAAWHRTGGPSTIQGTVLGDDGTIQVQDFPISRSTGETSLPAVAFDGTRYLVAWEDERDSPALFGTPVATDGTLLSPDDAKLSAGDVTVQTDFGQTALAWNGTRFLLVFRGDRPAADGSVVEGIEGSLVAPDLTVGDASLSFTQLPVGEVAPAVVWDGQDYVVSWIDERELGFGPTTVRAVRITTAGQVLDPDGILLSGDDGGAGDIIASNGDGRSFVVWSTGVGQSFERSLAADGTLGAIQTPSAAALFEPPVVAGNGRDYAILLATQGTTPFTLDLAVRMLRANGTLGGQVQVQRAADFAGASLVATGEDYLVSGFRNNAGEMIPVSRTGRVGRPIPVAMSSSQISAADSGRNTLVGWTGADSALEARLFDNGAFHGRTLQLAPTSAGFATAVAWDGRSYWAVWTGGQPTNLPFIRQISVNGALGPASQLLDDECEGPSLASNGRRQLLLACFKFSDHFRVVRATTRLIQTP